MFKFKPLRINSTPIIIIKMGKNFLILFLMERLITLASCVAKNMSGSVPKPKAAINNTLFLISPKAMAAPMAV